MDPLSDAPADPQPDWASLLPREAFHQIILILRAALPPPLIDDPVDWARRDNAAMAAVASLAPANAAEGRLAAQFVAADSYAMDCLRLAQLRRCEPDVARKCAAQAASMMRESKSALRVLLRLQAARQKLAGDPAEMDRAAWAEHGAAAMMQQALAGAPAAPASRHNGKPSSPAKTAPGKGMEVASGGVRKCLPSAKKAIKSDEAGFETEPRFWPPTALVAS